MTVEKEQKTDHTTPVASAAVEVGEGSTATAKAAAPAAADEADVAPTAATLNKPQEETQSVHEADETTFAESESSSLPVWPVVLLACQHASSSWGYRSAEFAYPLYFVVLFTDTLLPASVSRSLLKCTY